MNANSFNEAIRLEAAGKPAEAARLYAEILKQQPNHPQALYRLGNLHFAGGGFDVAAQLFEQAGRADPAFVDAHFAQGCALQRLNRLDAAIAAYDRTLVLAPKDGEALANRAAALLALKRHTDALASVDAALAADPRHVQAWFNRGATLSGMQRASEAAPCFERVLALAPSHIDARIGLGNALAALRRFDEALAAYDAVLTTDPNRTETLNNRAAVLFELRRYGEAMADAERLLAIDPDYPYARGLLLRCRVHLCDWRDFGRAQAAIEADVVAGKRVIQPFALLALSDKPDLHRRAAEIHALGFPPQPALWRGERYAHPKIRIAYLSADFSAHATAHLMAGVFEQHDKSRFETLALSLGRDDGSPMRNRLGRAFERFVDATAMSDAEAAAMLRAQEIDIAVDLKGYTQEARPGILSHRPAPVQAQYLGYPGTMAAPFIDYILADRIVIPEGAERYYSERVVRLQGSYQCNDRERKTAGQIPTRAQAGLPEQGFVFCCFNNVYKILPEMFGLWMRLLKAVEGSVLWLLEDNPAATTNLKREAQTRGISPDRLRFAPKVTPEDHLARHIHADLFLDTLPYGAHTTASDSLWMGVPVVTCLGNAFAGRVAASLLHATGPAELVAPSLAVYEEIAMGLARQPERSAGLRAKLAAARCSAPLFDTATFTRGLEQAYIMMVERSRRGDAPAAFDVPESR